MSRKILKNASFRVKIASRLLKNPPLYLAVTITTQLKHISV